MILSEAVRAEVRKWMALYPPGKERSALLPALFVIQREFGYCRVDAQSELAEMFDIEPAEVGGVVDFYHMFKTEPVGEYHVEVCTNVSCSLTGGYTTNGSGCPVLAGRVKPSGLSRVDGLMPRAARTVAPKSSGRTGMSRTQAAVSSELPYTVPPGIPQPAIIAE